MNEVVSGENINGGGVSGLRRRDALIALPRGWRGPRPGPAPVARKRIAIDDFLAWVYREELPKSGGGRAGPMGPAGGWDQMARWAEELPLAGLDDNRFGVVPDWLAQTPPHPDALAAHAAVQALDQWPLGLPEGLEPSGRHAGPWRGRGGRCGACPGWFCACPMRRACCGCAVARRGWCFARR